MRKGRRIQKATVSLVAAGAVALLAASPAKAKVDPNPGILPVDSSAHGQLLGEWAADYWKWFLETPAAVHPLETGDCAEGQSGSLWFLPGTFGDNVDYTCTVPPGKSLFLPVLQWIAGAGVFDCEPSVPGVECDVAALRAAIAFNTEAAEVLDVTIDGEPVDDVFAYRATSPEFALEYPEGNLVGLDPGTYFPHVADGYWMILTPLRPGDHTIGVHVEAFGTIPFGDIVFDVIWNLTVE